MALILATALVMVASWLVVQAVIAPGSGSFTTRLAASAREDGLGVVVTALGNLGAWLDPFPAAGTSDPSAPRARPRVTLPAGGSGDQARPYHQRSPRP